MFTLDRIRLRYGLFWRGRFPTLADLHNWWRNWWPMVAIALCYVVVAAIDDLDARATDMEQRAEAATRAAEIYRAHKVALANCASGAATGYVVGDAAYLCNITKVHP